MEMSEVTFLFLVIIAVSFSDAARDKDFYCAACEVIADEVEYAISKVDPKKTIEIEGFRVDPQGNQKSKSILYARSETHLTEVSENLCSGMNNYAQSKDKDSGRVKFVRTKSRDGEAITLENVSLSGDISDKLRFTCENIIEEHEEDIIKYFKKSRNNYIKGFCTKVTKLCSNKKDENKSEL